MSRQATTNESALHSLRKQWLLVAILWTAAWLTGYWLLRPFWPWATRWLALSAFLLAYSLWILWHHLPLNVRPGEDLLLPSLGPGNALSLMRGLGIGLIGGFLFGPWPPGATAWVIVLLYTATDVADYFDGYVARRANHVTELGSRLDGEFDSLGTLVVIMLAVSFGQLPIWYLALGLARYGFLLGIWWRQRQGLAIHALPPSIHRRVFAGFQMGFLSVVLWPIVPTAAATIFGTVIGLTTATGFWRDWLVVSGRVSPQSPTYQRVQQSAYHWLTQWLPLVWRLLAVMAMTRILLAHKTIFPPEAWRLLLESWHLPGGAMLTALLVALALVGSAMIALGAAGRIASLMVTLPLGFDIATRGLQWDNGLALTCAACLTLFGTGLYSLWQPEEYFLMNRLGGKA